MDTFIFLMILLQAFIVILILAILLRKPWEMSEDSPGDYWMGTGITLGIAVGLALGLVAGYAMENIPIGVTLGPAMGAGIGIAFGALLRSKYGSLRRRLNEAERNLRMWMMISALFLLFTVILALLGLFISRVLALP